MALHSVISVQLSEGYEWQKRCLLAIISCNCRERISRIKDKRNQWRWSCNYSVLTDVQSTQKGALVRSVCNFFSASYPQDNHHIACMRRCKYWYLSTFIISLISMLHTYYRTLEYVTSRGKCASNAANIWQYQVCQLKSCEIYLWISICSQKYTVVDIESI